MAAKIETKRGRPAVGQETIQVRMTPELSRRLKKYRIGKEKLPSESSAVRELLDKSLPK